MLRTLVMLLCFIHTNVASEQKLEAELNPKAATLDLYAYLVPCLVLDNIPKYKKSQSNHFLTTLTYIHTGGIADT